MSRRWTHEEDRFLLHYGPAIGADFIASHDLERPDGAGSRRLKFLTNSGAREAYIRLKHAERKFEILAGRNKLPLEVNDRLMDEELIALTKEKAGEI